MIRNIQDEICRLKQEHNVTILAHSYQTHDILEVADVVGDSFQLSRKAQSVANPNLMLCGVHFMAETAKILSPEKHVYLANPEATCPMAIQFTPEQIEAERAKHPGCKVVAYINTTAALKAVSDVCVTSSTADQIVRNLDAQEILFIPDCNLGSYVQRLVPEKTLHLLQGGCPIHGCVSAEELEAARQAHPGAKVLVHPECTPEVTKLADYVGATSGIMDYARNMPDRECIIGTEMGIVEHLQYEMPEKRFYPMSKKLLCADMKLTTLMDVLQTLQGIGNGTAQELCMDAALMDKARGSIDEMLRLGQA